MDGNQLPILSLCITIEIGLAQHSLVKKGKLIIVSSRYYLSVACGGKKKDKAKQLRRDHMKS